VAVLRAELNIKKARIMNLGKAKLRTTEVKLRTAQGMK
jgi:hypothetical protein